MATIYRRYPPTESAFMLMQVVSHQSRQQDVRNSANREADVKQHLSIKIGG